MYATIAPKYALSALAIALTLYEVFIGLVLVMWLDDFTPTPLWVAYVTGRGFAIAFISGMAVASYRAVRGLSPAILTRTAWTCVTIAVGLALLARYVLSLNLFFVFGL